MFLKLRSMYRKCRIAESNFLITFLLYHFYKIFYSKNLMVHHKVIIKGINNIETKYSLDIGMGYIGFVHQSLVTYLNIKGKLRLKGAYSIGKGCRFDIAENAVMAIDKGGFINANCIFIIMHGFTICNNCIISWDCQF